MAKDSMDNITLQLLSKDPHIVQVAFRGSWTWNEVDALVPHGSFPAESERPPLYIVADLTESAALPPSALVRAYGILNRSPSNMRQTIIITKNSFVEGLVTTFRKVFGKYQQVVAVVSSQEEALQIINAEASRDN